MLASNSISHTRINNINGRGMSRFGRRTILPGEVLFDAVISDTAKIGKKCKIGHFSKIGNNCRIGDNVTFGDGVTIVQNTTIGNNCTIQSGVVIGADGFSYERCDHSYELERFPHIGGVKIGNSVEISSNCSIARGSLSDTVINDRTKLGALVHIAHNVEIGRNCILFDGTIVGGSTKIGDNSQTGFNCTIKHKLTIGTNVIIENGASVINNLPDGVTVSGVPARSIKYEVQQSI